MKIKDLHSRLASALLLLIAAITLSSCAATSQCQLLSPTDKCTSVKDGHVIVDDQWSPAWQERNLNRQLKFIDDNQAVELNLSTPRCQELLQGYKKATITHNEEFKSVYNCRYAQLQSGVKVEEANEVCSQQIYGKTDKEAHHDAHIRYLTIIREPYEKPLCNECSPTKWTKSWCDKHVNAE